MVYTKKLWFIFQTVALFHSPLIIQGLVHRCSFNVLKDVFGVLHALAIKIFNNVTRSGT